jgi:lysophospholipase L1-like esterase
MGNRISESNPEAATLPPLRSSRWKRRLGNLALIAGSCIFALVIAEIVFRAVYYFPQPQFLRMDDVVGHRLRAGISGYYVEEGFSHYKSSSQSLRDREYSAAKPSGIFRVAVLGDSYCEAFQVGLDQTFHKIVAARLRQVELMNFGVSGYGTAQEFLTYTHYARPFAPQLALLVICPGNDISDNSRALSGGYPRPYFFLKDGRLELDNSFRQSRRFRLLRRWGPLYYFVTDHSALAESLDRWRRRLAQRRAKQSREENQGTSATVEAGLSRGIFGPPATPELRDAWEVTERLILELQRATRDDGTSLAIMTATMAAQVDPQVRAQTAREHPDWDSDYADRRIRQFAESHGIPCLVLAPGFLEYQTKTGRRLHGFGNASRGHWNAEGHRLAAEMLQQFLAERRLIPPEHLPGP